MAITPSDFNKIWSATADTPAYTFTDADYSKGWDFVGNLPPTRAQWNAIQKRTDEKMKYVFDNFGAPLVANTVADMTEQNRVYVYTGSEAGYNNGDWYYYDEGTSSWVSGGVYNSVAVSTDTTLSVAGKPADAEATGNAIKKLDAEMSVFGVDDLLWSGANFYDGASRTSDTVTFTVDQANNSVNVVGTSSGNTSFYRLFYTTTDNIIPTLQIGKKYIARIDNAEVKIQIYSADTNGISTLIVDTYTSQEFTLPADCVKTNVRILVPNGDSANTTVKPSISEAPTLYEINGRIETDVMKKMGGVSVPSNTDFNTLKTTSFGYLSTYSNYVNSPLENSQQGIIRIYNTGTMVTQFVNGTKSADQYVRRYYYLTDNWSDWASDFVDLTKLDKTEASLFGVQDLLWSGANFDEGATKTINDVTFTTNKEDRTINVVGTASDSNTFYRLFYDGVNIMPTLAKGKRYFAHIHADNVYLRVYYVDGNGVSHRIADTKTVQEFTIPNDAVRTSIRLDVLNGAVVNEVVRPFISEDLSLQELTENVSKKELKIFFMGHSTMQDGLTYVPWILQNVAPELELTMGIGYKSGTEASGVNGYVAGFDDPTYTFDIYSTYLPGASSWVNQNNSVTVKQALDDQEWDVVVPLEGILSTGGKIPSDDTTHFASLGTLIDQIISYIGRPIKIGAFFNHNRYATNSNVPLETADTFTDGIEQYKTYVWEAYASQFIFPNFTAYWNARGTTLDQYGDASWHHMLYDYAHYQEGIGCYLGSCCSALSILEIAGITDKSILGEQTRPDWQWVTDHNIPGKNGSTVVGISDANCLIAQKCAIMAHKFPWKISTIN